MHNKHLNTYFNKHALVIGNGPSAKELKKDFINRFDVVIGVNYAHKFYDKQMDFHLCIEQNPVKIIDDLNMNKYNTTKPRLFNPSEKDNISSRYNILWTPRVVGADIFNYTTGLLAAWPPYKEATVVFQAIHWAVLLGCNEISLIGCEHRWLKDKDQHFYTDYVEPTTTPNKVKIDEKQMVWLTKDGEYTTIDGYLVSAKCIDKFIEWLYTYNIKVYDYSDGLITRAIQMEL